MNYYKIKPEVPAGIGPNTVFDVISGGKRVKKLHLVFEGWLGGDLMETSPVFYVTERLRDAIIQSELKGIKAYLEVEISVSENFHELFPGKVMPHMYHLIIDGQPYINDFGVDEGYLIILSNTKNLLDNFDLSDAQVEQV